MSPAGEEQAERLAGLHAQAFDAPWTADAFRQLLRHPGAVALVQGGDGFILVRRVLDEAEVLTLAVRPAARRRGIGRALLEAAASLAAAGGAEVLWLEAAEDNAPALGLYRTAGFADAGRRPGYYPRPPGPPVAALTLRRALGGSPSA